jgi:isocitrate/isopropylmalate dehydrogenase
MKIALLAGDGIGPEIMVEAVRVLDVLRGDGLPIETEPPSSAARRTTIAASRCLPRRSTS